MLLATYVEFTTYSPFFLITTPHKAIESGDVSAVKHWLDEDRSVVNKCRGGTASHGHFFVGGGTALHWAAYYGQLEIVNLLVSRRAGTRFNSLLVAIKVLSNQTWVKLTCCLNTIPVVDCGKPFLAVYNEARSFIFNWGKQEMR